MPMSVLMSAFMADFLSSSTNVSILYDIVLSEFFKGPNAKMKYSRISKNNYGNFKLSSHVCSA